MRWSEVARGALLPALPVVGDPLAPAPLALLSELGDEVLEPDRLEEPLVVLDAPEASDGVLVLEAPPLVLPDAPPDVPLAPPEVPLAPPEDGRLRSTSPLEVPLVELPVEALPVDGTQPEDAAPVSELVPDVVPIPLALAPLVLVLAPAAPALVPALIPPVVLPAPLVLPVTDRVVVSVPVPFAPFVVFSPVNR